MVMILNLFPVLVLALVILLLAGVAVGTAAGGGSGGGGGCVFLVGVPIVVLAGDADIADVDICIYLLCFYNVASVMWIMMTVIWYLMSRN